MRVGSFGCTKKSRLSIWCKINGLVKAKALISSMNVDFFPIHLPIFFVCVCLFLEEYLVLN